MIRNFPPPPIPENRAVYETVENTVEPVRPQGQYGACAYHAGYQKLQTHTLGMCNINCFPTATMVARISLNVMYIAFLVCYVAEFVRLTNVV
jgi:hypothetical protein